jgi:butyryl-CoA dehydrogenase
MAKYYASEAANRIAYKALQIHGGYGFIKDYRS